MPDKSGDRNLAEGIIQKSTLEIADARIESVNSHFMY